VTNIEKLAKLIEEQTGEPIEKDAVFGFLAGLAGRGVGVASRAAGAIARGGGAIGRGLSSAGQAVKGYVQALPSAYRAGVVAGKGITSLPAPRGPMVRPSAPIRSGVERLKALRAGTAPAVFGQASPIPRTAMPPAAPPAALSATPSPSGKVMMKSPVAKGKGGRKAKTPVGAKPADAPGGAAANIGMMGASMMIPGGAPEEKTTMDMKAIIEKTAKLAANASDDEKVAALAQVSMESGFEDALAGQARALGYEGDLSKTAADEEKKEDEEKGEKKNDEKKEEEKDEKKKDLPPWLQKAKEKDKEEKESSARPILYNKFTTQDIIGHLAAQWGRHEPVEKEASERKPSASEKLARLVEKELAARPT